MPERCLSFDCEGESLVAILHEAEDNRSGLGILVVVGGPQYRVGSHRQFVSMARRFASAGYPVLRFDYRGMGDSCGQYRTFESVGSDIRAAIDAFVSATPRVRDLIIFGLCDAASAAMMYCSTDPRVRGLMLANPWVRTEASEARAYVRHYYAKRMLQRSFWGKALTGRLNPLAALNGLARTLGRSVAQSDAESPPDRRNFLADMATGLGSFRGAVLLVMSGRDLTARQFDALTATSDEWSSLVSSSRVQRVDLAAADHTFSSADTMEAALRAMLAWVSGHTHPQAGSTGWAKMACKSVK